MSEISGTVKVKRSSVTSVEGRVKELSQLISEINQ